MILNQIVLASNPFFDAYFESDLLGKLIFIGLIILSVVSWIVLLYKGMITYRAKKAALKFQEAFQMHKLNPLNLDVTASSLHKEKNPFLAIYQILKKQTLDILNKNRRFGIKENGVEASYLSPSDIDFVEGYLFSTISQETKNLEKHLYILSTVVTLAPFLGLLGTVWGILTTFSQLQANTGGSTHQMVLGGLSLALATTVLGLIDAIPALIGYNVLKHTIKDFQTEMESFSNELLSAVELQYRQVDVR